jgi:D-alanyl-D-alanine carboxypeptidase
MALDGTLSLDDKVSKYFGDEDWFDRLPNHEDVTLRMLLNHSGGMIDHPFESTDFHEAVKEAFGGGNADLYLTPRELLEFGLDREPLFPAGKGFHYTDTGYILAGMVMEKASGSTYYAELKKRFLEPLHFEFTMPQDRRRVPNLAQGYAVQSAALFGLPPKVVEDGELVFNPMSEWTGGGLFNNPQDLVRWAKTLYEGKAMKGEYLDDLFNSVAQTGPERSERSYGLGVGISETDFGTAYGHSGFFPGYTSAMRYFPDHGFAVAMQINSDADNPAERLGPLIQVVIEGLQ